MNKPMRDIFTEIAQENGLTLADMIDQNRARRYAHPRQEGMLVAFMSGHTVSAISRFLKRDHSTIIHGINAAEARNEA